MMQLLDTTLKNNVLKSMIKLIEESRIQILSANQKDVDTFSINDRALYDRLVLDDKKIDGMLASIEAIARQEDPVGKIISVKKPASGLEVINKTAPFGTILIIYESRPDVTIEAAVLAFKANNRILLKGGKEAIHSNRALVACWHQALQINGLNKDWITLLEMNREETRAFLKNPDTKIDLIVPRGGTKLINFVKDFATCAVLVSGRGNNFLYISPQADWEKSKKIIINAKTNKISACNALDKVLIDQNIKRFEEKTGELVDALKARGVEVMADRKISSILPNAVRKAEESIWNEEFLAMKIALGTVLDIHDAIEKINRYSGHHSSVIMTEDRREAEHFMAHVDSAAVYQNASSRFTDGGQMGVGAELAISTDKLHHRGPLGLKQLVTNKYYIFGDGQIRSS